MAIEQLSFDLSASQPLAATISTTNTLVASCGPDAAYAPAPCGPPDGGRRSRTRGAAWYPMDPSPTSV